MAPTHNLTRAEAAERSRLLHVGSYEVTLDLTGDEEHFGSRTVARFSCVQPGAETFIEIAAESIHRAELNGVELDVSAHSPENGLRLPGLAADNTLIVEATVRYSGDGQGLHRLTDPADGETYLFTHFESADAQRVYACFDQPDLKARFGLTVTLPERWRAVSNMPVAGETVEGESKTVRFEQSPPMSTFITALCVGPLYEVRTEHDGLDLGLVCRASMAEHLDSAELFALTGQLFDHYHEHFGVRYPLPKYDQVAVPEYNAGATENFGCVVFAEQHFIFRSRVTAAASEMRASVMAHEMAHMWFGNLVTPRWWDELWLKESFATWAGHWALVEATEFTEAWATFLAGQKNLAYREDGLSTTHPVRGAIPDVFYGRTSYDGITYQKGASVLKQLAAFVGVDQFCAGMRAYFRKHQWGTATYDDLRSALEAASGRDLSRWAGQWLETTGYNRLRPERGPDDRFAVVQEAPPEHPTLRDHRTAIGLYDLVDGELRRRARIELDISGERTVVPELDGEPAPDVLLLNDDDLTYARTRMDERSLRTALERVADFEETMPRALSVSVAWDMMRACELPPIEFVAMVARALPAEAHVGVADMTMLFVELTCNLYLPGGMLGQARAVLARAAGETLESAEPGSDRQRVWARVYADHGRDVEDATRLRGWLDGRDVPEGLVVDSGMRWPILCALAAAGAIGEQDIAAEAERDVAVDAREQALRARASFPDAAAKQRAWELLADDGLPTTDQRAILRNGFWQPGQEELTAPYTPRILELIEKLWESGRQDRAFELGLYLTFGPVLPETTTALDAWLDGTRPAPLRKTITSTRDEIARAVRVRESAQSLRTRA